MMRPITAQGGISGSGYMPKLKPKKMVELRIYPCNECGLLRSKAEGGTTFTVCDECWDKGHERQDK